MSAREAFGSAVKAAETLDRGSVPRVRAHILSVRITEEEHRRLLREAAGKRLSSHVRSVIFGNRGSRAQASQEDLAKALSALGRSPLVGTLKGVLATCDDGAVLLRPEAEDALRTACARITALRLDLIRALGLRPD